MHSQHNASGVVVPSLSEAVSKDLLTNGVRTGTHGQRIALRWKLRWKGYQSGSLDAMRDKSLVKRLKGPARL